ncbi:MAG TPA: LPXTG cell wall anchor domain-containing protein, partial [Candidatus Saccharimonadales bacterium]|nr:LPXTG cell wall anchor domain-containing protein [Candidatus Saccharimonadales bacterium]
SACCSSSFDLAAKISGNGADSENTVNLNLSNENNIYSVNDLNIKNKFNIDANTGGNRADKNTGGDVAISTGNVMVDLLLNNSGNSNVASIACNCNVAENPGSTTPTTPGVTPGVPAVMGATTNMLPNTGFDYPTKLILLLTAGLVGSGLILRKKSSTLEELLSNRFGI